MHLSTKNVNPILSFQCSLSPLYIPNPNFPHIPNTLKWIESSYMASMRFKALRAKKWWLETIQFLNTIRSTHKLSSAHIYDEIEKQNIEPLQLTRISSPENYRRTYPLSVGCIDFETDAQVLRISSPFHDDHYIELQTKFRNRKRMRRHRKLHKSLTDLQKIY